MELSESSSLKDVPGLCTEQITALDQIGVKTISEFLKKTDSNMNEIKSALDVTEPQIKRFSKYLNLSIIKPLEISEQNSEVLLDYAVELNHEYNPDDQLGEINRYHRFLANFAKSLPDNSLNYQQEISFIQNELFWLETSLMDGSLTVGEFFESFNLIGIDIIRLSNRTDAPSEIRTLTIQFSKMLATYNEARNLLELSDLSIVETYSNKIYTQFTQIQSLITTFPVGQARSTAMLVSYWTSMWWGMWDKLKKVWDWVKTKGNKISKELWAKIKKLVLIIEFVLFVWKHGRTVAACYTYCGSLHTFGSNAFWTCVRSCLKNPTVAGKGLKPTSISDAMWDVLKMLGVKIFLAILDDPYQRSIH